MKHFGTPKKLPISTIRQDAITLSVLAILNETCDWLENGDCAEIEQGQMVRQMIENAIGLLTDNPPVRINA